MPSCSDGIQNGDEIGIDCGGSCNSCIPFNVSLEKNVFNLSENVKVTVLARANSAVNLTVLLNGNIIDNEYITSYSPDYPIYVTKTIGGINQAGDYTINARMYYMSHSENKTLHFYVNDTSGNPLSVSINANATTINEGEMVGFSATITGNTSSVTYNWNFGDGTSTEKNPIHTYNTNGTYTVNLIINWNDWSKSAAQTITVRKLFNITISVKNESDQVIENARVEFDNVEKNTSSNGIASFLVNSGSRKLTVSKEYYSTFSNTTEINNNITIGVKLLYYEYDNEEPIIQLSKPNNLEIITQGNVGISYKVLDSSNANCTLYVNIDGGWWVEKAYEKDIRTSSEMSFAIENLENGHYQWKIECTDKFGNSQISETREFYVNKSIVTEQDASIDYIIGEIDNSISNLVYLDKNEKEAALALDLEEQLEKAKTELQRAKRDLNNLIWRRLNDTELEKERNSILDGVQEIKRKTPKTIKVVESREFVGYPSKEDVRNISFTLLESENKNYKKREKEAYANYNQELQNLIGITTKSKIIEVEYISEEKREITLIEKEVKIEENLKDTSLIEAIPKTIAANTSNINALFDYSIVLNDPIIKLSMPIEKYAYYIDKRIELGNIQEIKSVLVSNDIIKENPIIGFAIFGNLPKLVQSSNTRLIVEVIIILILAAVYLEFGGGFKKVKYLVKDRNVIKNIKEINQSVENAFTNLQNSQYEKAKSIYKNINLVFKQLPKEMKKDVYNKIVLLSNRLDVFHINKLIDKAIFSLENNQRIVASSIYKQVSQIYKDISPKFKSNVLERCNELHKRLNEVSKVKV